MMRLFDPLPLAVALLQRASLTPRDAGCQALLDEWLSTLGFATISLPFGQVSNLWAQKGTAKPLLCFAGHTDVVPPGEESRWHFPPFSPTVWEGKLFGRGASDMKSSLAAMVAACARVFKRHPSPQASVAFLITSDEEGPALEGTSKVLAHLKTQHNLPDYCIVGEASSEKMVGDVIKIGRRGSLSADLYWEGKQGHVAYPDLAQNAIHTALSTLQKLSEHRWDEGTEHFSPTCLQIVSLHAGTSAYNVIPGHLHARLNIRFSPASTEDTLKAGVRHLLDKEGFSYELRWQQAARPFLTPPDHVFVQKSREVIKQIVGHFPKNSTTGGTSDGRFFAAYQIPIIELGPIHATIHQANECILLAALEPLTQLYEALLEEWLCHPIAEINREYLHR